MAPGNEAIHILIADDDADDRLLLSEAFTEAGHRSRISAVSDGRELLDYLRQEAQFSDRSAYPPPDLVLLDLNMPRVDGREALREIKADPRLRSIPVVVFTTSNHPKDVAHCYADGANSYVVKPFDYGTLLGAVNTLYAYWGSLARLPREPGGDA